MRNITYAVEIDTGLVVSRVGSKIAFPVLEYDKIGEDGDFSKPFTYHLEKESVFSVPPHFHLLHRWTKKIPVEIKNRHRRFWGFPSLEAGTS